PRNAMAVQARIAPIHVPLERTSDGTRGMATLCRVSDRPLAWRGAAWPSRPLSSPVGPRQPRCVTPLYSVTVPRRSVRCGGHPMPSPLLARKPLAMLIQEARGESELRRVLGPLQLTSLGVGAVIGAGIFVSTGAVARQTAGPALMVSYMVAGLACVFAGLCYAEFASMVPVAGSAYTYAYATLGELLAWVIGWDLVLEYALSSATVATGWSGYFQSMLGAFGLHLPHAVAGPTIAYDPVLGRLVPTGALFNLPA